MQRLRQADAEGRLRFDAQVNSLSPEPPGLLKRHKPRCRQGCPCSKSRLKPGHAQTVLHGATAPLWHTRTHLGVQVIRCGVVAVSERLVALWNKVCKRSGRNQQRGRC